jgi:hypothetical protein
MVRAESYSHVTILHRCLLPRCPRGLTTEDGNGAGNEKTETGTATGTGTRIVTQEVQGQGDIAMLDADGIVAHVAPGEVCWGSTDLN